MKQILFSAVLTFFMINLGAQPWLENLPEGKSPQELNYYDYVKAFDSYWEAYDIDNNGFYYEDGKKMKASGWKQFKRWEWDMYTQINPLTGEFPKETAQQVYERYLKSGNRAKSDESDWSSLGPNSTSGGYAGIGRVNCIAFHPADNNTYWIGTPSGGLWKTSDNGSSWVSLTDNLAVIGISDIAVPLDFSTGNTMYMATGDRDGFDTNSIGVLKSTDGGQTWNTTGLSFSLSEGKQVNRLLIDPTNSQILYAAVKYDGIYKTTDGGTNWSLLTGSNSYIIDMEFKPGNSDIIYASNIFGKLYRSTDAGANWSTELNLGAGSRRIELAVSPDEPTRVYAVSESNSRLYGVYKSTDSGDNFSQIYNSSNLLGYVSDGSDAGGQAWYDISIAASPSDANILVIGGINTQKSIDGGLSWQCSNCWTPYSLYNLNSYQVIHADKHNHVFRSNGDLFECNDGGIYISTDFSSTNESWTDKSGDLIISQMYRLGISQTYVNEIITGLQDNGTKQRWHGNSQWYDVMGGDGMECLIDYSDNDIQYGSYPQGELTRTNDDWYNTADITPSGKVGEWVTPYIIHPASPATLFAGYDEVMKTTNRGGSWTTISNFGYGNNINCLAVSESDPATIYASAYNKIWKTTDGGSGWSDITTGLPVTSALITSIAVKHDASATLWVGMSGYNADGVYESTDGGNSWTNISDGLPQIPVNSIIENKQITGTTHLYAGTELGIYFKNGSDNWTEFSTNLPNVKIGELEIYYNTSNPGYSKLRAATYGRGLWQSFLASQPSDVQNITSDNRISVYPNPSDGKFTVELSHNITGHAKLIVYDISGRELGQQPLTGNVSEINLKLSAGLYQLVIETEQAKYTNQLIIK